MSIFDIRTTGDEAVRIFADRVKGKIIALTGASVGGLGAQTVLDLATQQPHTLILLGRCISRVQPVIDSIISLNVDTVVHFVSLDLASENSVRAAAQEVATLVPHLDILINNAAIMALPNYTTAPNFHDVELQFASNHLGHFLLTNLLVPTLSLGSESRIVNVSSEGHAYAAQKLDDVQDINYEKGRVYDAWEAYGMSKLANILFGKSLAAKLEGRGIRAYSVHPGWVVETNLADNLLEVSDGAASLDRFIQQGRKVPLPKSIAEGSATTLVAALDPSLNCRSGSYLNDCKIYDPTIFSVSPEIAEKMWSLSEDIINERFRY